MSNLEPKEKHDPQFNTGEIKLDLLFFFWSGLSKQQIYSMQSNVKKKTYRIVIVSPYLK